jgi:UDP-N-acetylmuramoyl-L-alanyl-D-glutamate--2,6-diaminopimelate ligase
MQQAGCTAVVMEVSSHALKQHRVLGIPFDGVLFTNLSHEHLDLHKTMEDYFETKALLFTEYLHFSKNLGKNPVAAVHTQDAYGMELLRRMQAKGLVARPFSLASRPLTFSASGITGTTGNTPFSSPLVGRFNAENVLGVVELMEGLGIAEQAIVAGLDRLRFVPGRMERVDDPRGAHLFVDYAHKPGALEVVLKTLRESLQGSSGRLLVLFGCGGDRDQLKRPEMGRIATRLADQVWVTSDNPRTEEPEAIVQAILSGVPDDLRQKCVAQLDRREAIRAAVAEARAGDILLVAGRGHEQDQVVGTSKVHFDDREEVKVALGAMVHQQELPGTL